METRERRSEDEEEREKVIRKVISRVASSTWRCLRFFYSTYICAPLKAGCSFGFKIHDICNIYFIHYVHYDSCLRASYFYHTYHNALYLIFMFSKTLVCHVRDAENRASKRRRTSARLGCKLHMCK